LKDGQIVESGAHSDLLARDGIFANMWNDQMSTSDQASLHKGQLVSGYDIGEVEPILDEEVKKEKFNDEVPPPSTGSGIVAEAQDDENVVLFDKAEDVVVGEEVAVADAILSDVQTEEPTPVSVAPSVQGPEPPPKDDSLIAFPGPVSFPSGSGDADSQRAVSEEATRSPIPAAVTFEPGQHPSRAETPDPESEPKRKRISSQNFQRLARKLSVSAKRTGSSSSISIPSIPGFRREGSSLKASKDESQSDAPPTLSDSPSGSIHGDNAKVTTRTKKDKKDKRKTLG